MRSTTIDPAHKYVHATYLWAGSIISVRITQLNAYPSAQFDYLSQKGYDFLDELRVIDERHLIPSPKRFENYELYYYDFGWKLHSSLEFTGGDLVFDEVPECAALVVKEKRLRFTKSDPLSMTEKNKFGTSSLDLRVTAGNGKTTHTGSTFSK